MKTSETLTKIMPDYLKAQAEIKNIAPNKKGYGYDYVDLAKIIEKSKPYLLKFNLVVIQSVGKSETEGISITTRLQHVSGEFFEDTFSLPLTTMKSVNNVQAMGASITYGRRYGLGAILGIATDEDVDGKIEEKNESSQKETTSKKSNNMKAIIEFVMASKMTEEEKIVARRAVADCKGDEKALGIVLKNLKIAYGDGK